MASAIIYSLLGGILPALIWLIFWLQEDAKRPEPKGMILITFLAGMAAVVLVIPFQIAVESSLAGLLALTVLLWALLEEAFKLGAAYFGGLGSTEDDEPIDSLVYVITAALGFVALENALFIAGPLFQADILGSFMTGNLRFIGTSVLHVVSSAIVGVALALSFYKPIKVRVLWAILGLGLATLFHTAFNLALINESGPSKPVIFGIVWASAILLLVIFEKVKTLKRPISTVLTSQETTNRDTI